MNTQPTATETEPLVTQEPMWPNEAINWVLDAVPECYRSSVAVILKGRRDSYEAKLAQQAARIDELSETIGARDRLIGHLSQQLSICNEYADKLRGEKSELAEQYYRLRAGLPEKDGNE